jgi:hypothetical protein
VFGGGIFSTAHSSKLKTVGSKKIKPVEIRIRKFRGIERKHGKLGLRPFPFYVPKSANDEFHPGGNSLCFAIQLAHVMGANPIICSGFTLESGSRYFFGEANPVTRRRSFYQQGLAMDWLRGYQAAHPGRARLDPLFGGPVTGALPRASVDELLQMRKQ